MVKKTFVGAFVIWLIPFLLRIYCFDFPQEKIVANTENTQVKILQAYDEGNSAKVFLLIFSNNIKGCVINVLGGFLLSLGTLINLAFNGFASADAFVNVYNSGFSICNIFKTTLPHSFELIGFWLSGAMGFSITWNLIQFMRGKNAFDKTLLRKMLKHACLVVIIIVCSAFVEAYISV